MKTSRAARGFTLVELLMAMAVMATIGSAFVSLIVAGQSIARAQPEIADQQQRARMAIQALAADLARAGTGVDRGRQAGPLGRFFPPIDVSPGDAIRIWYASIRGVQASLSAPLANGDMAVAVDAPSGFTAGSTAIVFDQSGCHDLLRVTGVSGPLLVVAAAARSCEYAAGATVAAGEVRTYLVDPVARQLQRRDEATGLTLPLLDNIARMSVESLDGGGRVRISLQVAPAAPRPDVRDLVVAFDVMVPNAWLS
jgi:prepilin-type N-terminal cleavage/methylation domain-containing protein